MLMLVVLTMLIVGCVVKKAPVMSDAYKKISADKAKAMMDEGGVIVVDVRSAMEYDDAHVPGATLLPLERLQTDAAKVLPDVDATLLIYCQSGLRSYMASRQLVAMGYKHIYDFGGIMSWPYDVERSAAK